MVSVLLSVSGTTWLQEITWLITNEGNFGDATQKPVYFRSPFLEFKDEVLNEVGIDLANPMPSPRVIKTHLPVKLAPKQMLENKCKVIFSFILLLLQSFNKPLI